MKKTWITIDLQLSFFHNNRELTIPIDIANAFNSYFAAIGQNIAAALDSDHIKDQTYSTYLNTPHRSEWQFKCVSDQEIIIAIDNLENKSSTGCDGISNKLLKFIKDVVTKPLTLIINQMIVTGIYPKAFKTSKVSPLFKKVIINYLVIIDPFRCCPQSQKIFERIIYNQLSNYFNDSNLLAEQQYRFRPRHSTELAAVKLVDFISHEMESGHTPTNIYVDLSKAFDTINYDILLDKLSYYGISGRALKLLKSYLLDRKQYVVYNNCNSNLVDVTTGVPQGSILGPLLFSIFINDLIHVTLKFIMDADDTTIYFNLEDFDPATIERDINSELEKINVWLKLNKLSLNVKKTKSVIFNRKQKQIAEITLSINGEDIENVEHFNFLSIILDENLSWKNHINMLSNKVSKVIGVMYKLKNVLPEYILLILYNSLISSHLNYGLFVWEIKADRLEILQKKAVRIVTKKAIS